MQISKATKSELALLIHGLRSIYVEDLEDKRKKLLIQLQNELLTRFSVRVVLKVNRGLLKNNFF
jgi:hypothetical protein